VERMAQGVIQILEHEHTKGRPVAHSAPMPAAR
jgi:hypothetical protein